MMRVFITTLFLLSSSYIFSQNKYMPTSSAHTQIVSEKLAGVFTKIHQAYKAGEIKVYLNDSLRSEMSMEYFEMYFGQIDESKLYKGFKAICSFNGITKAKQQREFTCIAPLYHMTVDGLDAGVYAMYYVKMADVEKLLDKNTLKTVLAYFSLAEKTVHNTPHYSNNPFENQGNFLSTKNNLPSSIKLNDWVFGRVGIELFDSEISEIYDASKTCMVSCLEMALLRNSLSFKVYEDQKLTQRILQLNVYEPFMRSEVIVIPDQKYPGEFKDSTVLIGPNFYNIHEVKYLGNSVQIKFDEHIIYLRKKDFESIIPEWIRLVLLSE